MSGILFYRLNINIMNYENVAKLDIFRLQYFVADLCTNIS